MTEYFDGWLTNLSKYVADLNTELVKTKAKNAELLRELDLTKHMYANVSEEKCVADSENAKLRALLSDTLMDPQKYCEKYDIEYEGWNSANTHIDTRMRELGIETEAC